MYLCRGFRQNTLTEYTIGYIVGTYLYLSGASVTRQKKTHQHKGCGWLAFSRGSKYKKKHIMAKDVVGLLLGVVVRTQKNTSLQRMWLA
jgi:hypothetical protein